MRDCTPRDWKNLAAADAYGDDDDDDHDDGALQLYGVTDDAGAAAAAEVPACVSNKCS